MSKILLNSFFAVFLFFPIVVFGQTELDDDNDNELSNGDTHETLQGAGDSGVYQHTGNLTFKDGLDFVNKLQMSTTPGIGGADDTYSNYVIIKGNLTVESGATVSINNNGLLIITGDLIIQGSASFHNSGYFIVMGSVSGSGTIDNGSGGSALPAYIAGDVENSDIIADADVDSPANIADNTVNNILDFEDVDTSLPVELISFTASKTESEVKLNWSTASEENASHFEVYVSKDNKNWDLIGSVDANGNSSTRINYTFSDDEDYQTTVYYKLIQYDFDGKNETFGPLAVQFSNDENTFTTAVFPNPSNTGNTSVQIGGMNLGATTTLQLINREGKVILFDTIDSNNITSAIYQLSDKVELKPGLYVLKVNSGVLQDTKKIIVQ
ncbi:T9SS type A sorting domain-containing protein [Flammeovirga sp. SJP92]|uniref:T9SS type A sorting domain-containing protein n=1 Tax=Flammeovirga sp. SJP92 TaxID=1775430 RepID=UPI0007893439|nr:T9SS type A sorting domain-containing protein [Flammeovirga sp. SJP92]KXX70055.1 hypothetical protein AVL50_14370 [Flammeovirga sp. SJP92]